MEDTENEYEVKRMKSRSPSPGVKSTAIVKYTAYRGPVGYAELQCNTDLNTPPNDWGAAIDSYGLKQIVTDSDSGLSSFRMAHMFPDAVGDVDVISGAECIKKLLKLPYQPNGTVSMIVHRVENTILLDEFRVYDYLMKTEWSWLKDFFYENILKTMSEQERLKLMLSPAPSSALQLTHTFLSHSVTQTQVAECPTPQPFQDIPMTITGPFLPEGETYEKEEVYPMEEHLYNRNVLWTFEDIHMLIGSDLPIFGDKDRPCVSLRLRDAREPVNVLTGIDYWLDNLMCNVPEVLMCYHLDGIVQEYEPMKTEDLPNMENSKFSPKVIRNVAQNILSFLKCNATKSGHTYWLFKGPRDDVVKLYDLTALCPDSLDNPFTTPVAMLLYKVARNMRMTKRSKHVKQLLEHVIKLLKVEKYPQIIASSHYMLADLYVPATTDPADPNFEDETAESEDDSDFYEDPPEKEDICEESEAVPESKTGDFVEEPVSSQNDDDKSLAVQIRGLALKEIGDKAKDTAGGAKRHSVSSDLAGKSVPERCGRALHHALHGLRALHNITSLKCKEEERERLKQQIISEEQHPKMANPYEPIKMDYEPISKPSTNPKEHTSRKRKKRDRKTEKSSDYLIASSSTTDKNAIQIVKEPKVHPNWHEPNRDDDFAWKLHLKTLLYEKICLVYATLAEYSYAKSQYGLSLKYIDIASKCQKLLCNMIIKSKVVDASCLIGRVGDNYFQISKSWSSLESYKEQFQTDHDIDVNIRLEIENDLVEEVEGITVEDFDLEISFPTSQISAMLRSIALYTRAADVAEGRRAELLRRRASVLNELAVRYMHDAHQIYQQYDSEPDQSDPKARLFLEQFHVMSRKSLECLDEATDIFKQVNDIPNLALLNCNKGRYLRFRAHSSESSSERRRYYSEAEDMYYSALKLLGPRETCGATSVWELVSWELSSHLYNKALAMQDAPGLYGAAATAVADALRHALKYCLLSPGPRQYLYQFRAAMIYHRLGSLAHSQFRFTTTEGPKRRSWLGACRSNYELATNMFALLEDAAMFLTVQMEYVAVLETQAAVSPNLKLKSLQSAVQLLRKCHSIMTLLKEKEQKEKEVQDEEVLKESPTPEDEDRSMKNEINLLSLYENRLHHILKGIIQYCRSKSNRDYEKIADTYKKLYCAALKIKKNDDVRLYAGSICDALVAMDEIHKEFD